MHTPGLPRTHPAEMQPSQAETMPACGDERSLLVLRCFGSCTCALRSLRPISPPPPAHAMHSLPLTSLRPSVHSTPLPPPIESNRIESNGMEWNQGGVFLELGPNVRPAPSEVLPGRGHGVGGHRWRLLPPAHHVGAAPGPRGQQAAARGAAAEGAARPRELLRHDACRQDHPALLEGHRPGVCWCCVFYVLAMFLLFSCCCRCRWRCCCWCCCLGVFCCCCRCLFF